MRYHDIIKESDNQLEYLKAWYHPKKNKFLEIYIFESHHEFAYKNRKKIDVEFPKDAIDNSDEYEINYNQDVINSTMKKNGWVRLSNFNEAEISMVSGNNEEERGFIDAPDLQSAKKAAALLVKKNIHAPIMDIEINNTLITLIEGSEKNIYDFIKGKITK